MKLVLATCLFVMGCGGGGKAAPTLPEPARTETPAPETVAPDAPAPAATEVGAPEAEPASAPAPHEQAAPPVRTRGPVPKSEATVDPCDGGE